MTFSKNKINIFLWLLAFLLNIGDWVYLYFNIKPSDNPIYLHYNIYYGVDLIGAWYYIYALPLLGLAIVVMNMLIGSYLYRRHHALTYILLGVTFFSQLLLLWATALIIRQNI